MNSQNFKVVLDISSIIWDEDAFKANKSEYYNLIFGVSELLEKIEKEGLNVLIRDELQYFMIEEFPFDRLPDKFYEFGNIVYSFLANVGSHFITYSDTTIGGLVSIPNQIKSHFKDSTKKEIGYLMSNIHSENESTSVYFTFKYLWNGNDQLKTKTKCKTNTYETIIADNGNDFFEKFKLIFEHKDQKHNCSIHKNRDAWNKSNDKGAFQSQLSCFHDKNTKIVQGILDKRYFKYFGNEYYYGYDDVNDVYVVFRKTRKNIYHAYDMYDIERVPQEVKKKFNIWKY